MEKQKKRLKRIMKAMRKMEEFRGVGDDYGQEDEENVKLRVPIP